MCLVLVLRPDVFVSAAGVILHKLVCGRVVCLNRRAQVLFGSLPKCVVSLIAEAGGSSEIQTESFKILGPKTAMQQWHQTND